MGGSDRGDSTSLRHEEKTVRGNVWSSSGEKTLISSWFIRASFWGHRGRLKPCWDQLSLEIFWQVLGKTIWGFAEVRELFVSNKRIFKSKFIKVYFRIISRYIQHNLHPSTSCPEISSLMSIHFMMNPAQFPSIKNDRSISMLCFLESYSTQTMPVTTRMTWHFFVVWESQPKPSFSHSHAGWGVDPRFIRKNGGTLGMVCTLNSQPHIYLNKTWVSIGSQSPFKGLR